MSVNSTKLSNGGETGEIVRRPSIGNRILRRFTGSANATLSLKHKVAIATAVFLLFLGIGAFINYLTQPDPSTQVVTLCDKSPTSSIYNDAAKVMQPEKIEELGTVVQKIEQQPNYNNDVNCVIPVLYYYMYQSNLDKVKEKHATVKNLASEGAEIASIYKTSRLVSYEEIDKRVGFLEKSVESMRKNVIYP